MNRLAVTPFLFCSLLALAVTACGDDGNGGDPPDAMEEPRPDAMEPIPPDGGPDVPPDAIPPDAIPPDAIPPDATPPTPEIVLSATTLSVNEGSSAEITVKLSVSPRGPLAVNVASSDPGAATVDPPSLDFTDADFGTEQTLTVTAPNDVDGNNENLTLTFSATGLADVTVDVSVVDDDSLNILASATTVTVAEEDTATFDVSLTVLPNQDVTVTVASNNEGKATVDVTTLTFTQANYDQPQTVTVSGLADADVADDAAAVTLSSAGLTDVTVSVTVDDDDTQTIQTSAASVNVDEGGDGNFTVRLSNDPLGPVDVTVSSSDGAAATASPSTLTFDSSNYDDPQTVTVSGTSDENVADTSATVTLSAPEVENDATVTVNVNDDDTQTILVSATSVSVNESGTGNTGQFTVRLSHDPLTSFTVTLTSTDAGAATVSPTSLTFNSSNYTVPQTVTASGVSDTDRNAESVPVRLSGAGVADVNVTVNVADTTPPFPVDMFVRVTQPAGQAGNHLLTYLGNDRYRATVALVGPAVFNFKIGDANNTLATTFAVVNPTNPVMTLGTPKTLTRTNNNNNQLLIIQNATGTFNYVFDFDASNTTNPVLTVTLP